MPEDSQTALLTAPPPVVMFAFGSRIIEITVTRKDRKTLGLRVHPDGQVVALVPSTISDDQLNRQLSRKAPWIAKQLRFFESFPPQTPPRRYVNGESHRYLGRQYRLRVEEAAKPSVRLQAGWLYLSTPVVDPVQCEQVMSKWYRERAEIYFAKILADWLPRFTAFGLPTPTIRLRNMPTRWGSCTTSGIIYLNPEIIKAPGSSIAYVLVHELCHMVHHRHDREFYDLLGHVMPNWKKRKDHLEHVLI